MWKLYCFFSDTVRGQTAYVYNHKVILFLVCIRIIGNSCKSSLRNNARYWILNVRYSLCTLHIGSSYDFIPCMLCKPSFYLEVGTDKSISSSFANSIESRRYVFLLETVNYNFRDSVLFSERMAKDVMRYYRYYLHVSNIYRSSDRS